MRPADTAAPAAPTPRQVGEHLYAADRASRGLGIALVAIGDGSATLTMTVRDDMLNGHAICHGGFITTLADSAFAFACNAGNVVSVASGLAVEFLAPASGGDVLTAVATETARSGRSGVYDMVVTNQRGERIALVRGRSHRFVGRSVMPVAAASVA